MIKFAFARRLVQIHSNLSMQFLVVFLFFLEIQTRDRQFRQSLFLFIHPKVSRPRFNNETDVMEEIPCVSKNSQREVYPERCRSMSHSFTSGFPTLALCPTPITYIYPPDTRVYYYGWTGPSRATIYIHRAYTYISRRVYHLESFFPNGFRTTSFRQQRVARTTYCHRLNIQLSRLPAGPI